MKIPFNKPFVGSKEISNAVKVIKSRRIGGNGPIGQQLESFMKDLF